MKKEIALAGFSINPASKYFNIVIVRLDRTIQNKLKRLDSPIKSGNDKLRKFKYLFADLIKPGQISFPRFFLTLNLDRILMRELRRILSKKFRLSQEELALAMEPM